jgi:site-specific recombinase XerD
MMKTLKDKRLFENIRDFLTMYLPSVRNRSENTIFSYCDSLKLLVRFFEEQKGVDVFSLTTEMITRDSIVEFLDWLESERGCTASTINTRLSCVRTFYKFISLHGNPLMTSTMGEIAEITKRRTSAGSTYRFLEESEVALVLRAPDTKTPIGIRDCCYLTLLYDSGARNSEMLSLKLQDITITGKTSKILILGKGGKSRITPISVKATAIMLHYMDVFHPTKDKSQYLFYIERKGVKSKMSADNTARIMIKYEMIIKKSLSQFPHLHPHLMRHSRAQNLYSAGMPLPLVSEWLGHSDMEVTLVYAHADVEMKRKAIEKAMEHLNILPERESPKYMTDQETIKKLYGIG